MTSIYMHLAGNKLLLSFDNNQLLVAKIKKIPGVRWIKELGRWEATLDAYDRLVNNLDNLVISKAVMERLSAESKIGLAVEELRKKEYHEIEDYSPKLPLMSHQKKAFELHRMLPGSADFSEMGAGKCLIPKDLQLINGELVAAEEVWNLYSGEAFRDENGWWSTPKQELIVASLSAEGRLVNRRVSRLFRQHIKEKIRKIILDDGNSVTITQAHKLYKTNTWDNKLQVNDIVCVPRYLPHQTGQEDLKLAELFGWMVGDGCDSNPKSNKHQFTQKEDIDRNKVKKLMEEVAAGNFIDVNVYEVEETDTHRAKNIVIQNKQFRDLCEQHGYKWGRLSAGKEVPSSIMKADEKAVAAFLQGYFDAEAYVYLDKYSIEISSASHLLIKQVACLLRRFGIWLRIRKKRARATNGKNIWRDYWVGMIGGPSARIFKDKIGFSIKHKREDLEKFVRVIPNSNVEGLPASKLLREIVDKTGIPQRHITGSYTVYMKGTQDPSRATLQKFIENIDKILDGTKRAELSNLPSKQTLELLGKTYKETKSYEAVAKELNAKGLLTINRKSWYGRTVKTIVTKGECFPFKEVYDNLDKNWLKEKRDQLQKLIDQELHYVSIKNIEEIDYEGWVYDLEVEEDHNYVAENILCHNTGSAICNIHWNVENGLIDKALVICPKSVLRGWEEQIEMFSNLTYVSITGAKAEDRMKKLSLDRNIFLINYEYTWRIVEDLLKMKFNMVVCDEAHRIKDPGSKQSKACYALGDAAEYRIGLTGTPVLNSSLDAFGVMRFVDPTVFGESFYSFRSKYFVNIGPDNSPIQKFVAKSGSDEIISDKMYTRALRFLKEECLDLPDAIHMPDRMVSLGKEQDQAYRQLRDDLCTQILNDKTIKINHVLTLMLKLNQVTSGWIKDSDTGEIIRFKENPKFEELKTIVEEAQNQPIILWAYYIEDMKILIEYYGRCKKCKEPVNHVPDENCPKCGTFIDNRCSEVQGSTKHRNAEIAKFRYTPEERAEMRKKFLEEGKIPQEIKSELGDQLSDGREWPQTNIIINQVVAASEGLNLQRATLAIFYSRNWSLKDWSQALARNHRKGQTKRVTYINLVARLMDGDETVDQRIVDALKRKEDLSKRVNKDDLKLLMGNFKKIDREAFKNIVIEENAETDVVPETELQQPDANQGDEQSSNGLLF